MQCLSDHCEGDCIYLMVVKSPLSSALALITLGEFSKRWSKEPSSESKWQSLILFWCVHTLKYAREGNYMLVKWKGPQLSVITECLLAHQTRSYLHGIFESVEVRVICPHNVVQLKGCNRLITRRWTSINSCGYPEYSSLTSLQATCKCNHSN